MPYVPVPKDLTKIKTKIAFNLTKRQLICFSLAGVVGVPTYLFMRTLIGNDPALLFMILLMFPLFLVAMYEKDGQPFEKVLRNIVRVKFLFPAQRPYQTNDIYSAIERSSKEVPHIEQSKKIKKRTPTITKKS